MTRTRAPAPPMPQGRDRWEVLVCCLAGFATLLDSGAVAISLPALRAQLGATTGQTQWVLAAYSLAFGLALVPAGRLGDVLGRRRLFLGGVAVFSAAALVSALAAGAWQVVGARLLQGAAAGVISSQVLGIIADRFTGILRARALAAYGVAIGLAGVAGPVSGGLVLALAGEETGWRWALALNVPFGVLALIGAAVFLRRDGARRGAARFDLVGLVLLAAAVLLVLVPLVARLGAAGTGACLVAAGAVVVLLVRWERGYARSGGTPVLVPDLVAARGFTLGAGVAAFYFGAALAANTVLTMYLIERQGLSALQAALVLVGGGLAMAASSGIGWRVAARFGRATVVWALFAEAVIVVAYVSAVDLLSTPAVLIAVAFLSTASGVASGLVDAPNRALTLEYAPPAANGVAAGFLQLVQRLSATVALTATSGLYLARPHEAGGLVLALGLCLAMFVAGLCCAVLDARRRATRRRSAEHQVTKLTVQPAP
ncbi:MFS transporter [Tsukamurella asaccharolytica]|uniref:MFS transporter n=1 Tax=Tsukamurella asaccharolytica TaxID=2592067 RepID=A0A5C5R958_9ACTN|nr:MFS transporter [Tsukamurella asaccharolytica]TWS19480.1 MFS transporter [Tsukamurella asaccharolytica]